MELLVQIFAPLDGSAYDRVLFVWGCARGVCQRQAHGR
jgi:pre-rRNA-processing protein TSR4